MELNCQVLFRNKIGLNFATYPWCLAILVHHFSGGNNLSPDLIIELFIQAAIEIWREEIWLVVLKKTDFKYRDDTQKHAIFCNYSLSSFRCKDHKAKFDI